MEEVEQLASTPRAMMALLLQGFEQHYSIFMKVTLQNVSYTRADPTRNLTTAPHFDWTDISLAVTS